MGAGKEPDRIVERAAECGCRKVQLIRGHCTKEMIEKAHALGMRVNYWYSDSAEEAEALFDLGVDTVLTDRFRTLQPVVEGRRVL